MPSYQDTLAAACAETGDFDQAIAIQLKALENKMIDKELRTSMETNLALFKAKKPVRE